MCVCVHTLVFVCDYFCPFVVVDVVLDNVAFVSLWKVNFVAYIQN